jgi:hypothetical protein
MIIISKIIILDVTNFREYVGPSRIDMGTYLYTWGQHRNVSLFFL